MIEIDGSSGEGGGQIVRTAVSLSAVTGRAVKIRRIREGRPKPGLAPQHAHAIEALAAICDAETEGIAPGSSQILFSPGRVRSGSRRIEIGTAGSVTLLMQCLLPALIHADAPSTLLVSGGTDVKWSPSIDYFKNVFLPAIAAFGAEASLELLQRGYYPRGGGEVRLEIMPSGLVPAHFGIGTGEAEQIRPVPAPGLLPGASPVTAPAHVRGVSHCSNLPIHVAARQAEAANARLKVAGLSSGISEEAQKAPSTGSGITLWLGQKGAGALGERGLPAELVGRMAADELILELGSHAGVDMHLADQLIPYLALAGGGLTVREVSMHTKTNIWTVGHFLDSKIEIAQERGLFRIECRI